VSALRKFKALAAIAFCCLVAELSFAQTSHERAPTIQVQVNLVNVFTSVTDADGNPVNGLTQNDFQIFEDGVPQKIAIFAQQSSVPLSLVLAIDTSLSTRMNLKFEQSSARRFAEDVMNRSGRDAMALYEFSRDVQEVVPFTPDVKRFERGIDSLEPGSNTALYDAIYLGSKALNGRQGKKVMVLITDGGDNGSTVSYQDALRAAQTVQATIYSIIIVPIHASAGRDLGGEHALIQLARDTGGKYFYADSASALDGDFRRIREELRTQYLLAYYPVKRDADSDFRQIDVELAPGSKWKTQGLKIRHRSGYYTSKLE